MKDINSILSAWKAAYLQQGPLGRILLPGSFLLVLCCLCSITTSLLRSGMAAIPVSGPSVSPTQETQATSTALFGFPSLTPFPTSTAFVPSPFPTLTPSLPSPTETQTPAPTIPPATLTPLPTDTPLPTATNVSPVRIIHVNKLAEYVDIQNFTQAPVDLAGWRLVSENGNESCTLRGMLEANATLRIWSNRGPGFDCRLPRPIWNDVDADPAVLYNNAAQVISRFP